MRTRHLLWVAIAVGLLLALAGSVGAASPDPTSIPAKELAAGGPVTLQLNLGEDPSTLDPSKALSSASTTVIEQLFLGLVDLNDATGEILPELASHWSLSADSTVYTFTLRSDARWSDGHPVTAQDVRYGILRSLNPASQSGYAYTLSVIKNAAGYSEGTLTDPAQVGVVALDDTHLQITLERPAAYILSILSMWDARPMPQWTIEAWGDAWTDPAHIVTNGPYRLSEWVHNDHILLSKNPTYYDAANVQIERVKMWMVTESAGWSLYRSGQLDTASVPLSQTLDAVTRQDARLQPVACIYYYGFSFVQPPFDNPLVRKAFAAATNRQGMVDSVRPYSLPSLTFTSPGLFGAVDGYTESIGIPYNPRRARQYLAQAGYPNGRGLPPITLWTNSGAAHESIAAYLRNSWYSALGVSVTLQILPWSDYLPKISSGEFQIWRNGWCKDYGDAYNFLGDGADSLKRNGWANATYDDLLQQAAREQDPTAIEALYRQAEEILVESDAAVLPIYHFALRQAGRRYLERTYPSADPYDIAAWRITRVSANIEAQGGTLTSYDQHTSLQIPAGAFFGSAIITHTPAYGMPPEGSLFGTGQVFEINTAYADGQAAAPALPYTLTVHYTERQRGPAIEDTLALYFWDGSQWVKEPTSQVDAMADTLAATPSRLGLWGVFGETRRLYLPLGIRDY